MGIFSIDFWYLSLCSEVLLEQVPSNFWLWAHALESCCFPVKAVCIVFYWGY